MDRMAAVWVIMCPVYLWSRKSCEIGLLIIQPTGFSDPSPEKVFWQYAIKNFKYGINAEAQTTVSKCQLLGKKQESTFKSGENAVPLFFLFFFPYFWTLHILLNILDTVCISDPLL